MFFVFHVSFFRERDRERGKLRHKLRWPESAAIPLWVGRPWMSCRSVSVWVRRAKGKPATPTSGFNPVEHSSSPSGVPWSKTQGPLEMCQVVGLLLNGESDSKLETTQVSGQSLAKTHNKLTINQIIDI